LSPPGRKCQTSSRGELSAHFSDRSFNEQTWRKPAVTIIALEASSIKGASNQVLPRASAIVSCRIVPDQDPAEAYQQLRDFLTQDPPWGVKVTVRPQGEVKWWMTDPTGPAFEAALAALK
jgi:acetylornithine deacetylase/succinyl-diaminopimelate desuccinylase-like protein